MDMTAERWNYTKSYLQEVFGKSDAQLEGLMDAATAAGIPDIAVSADVGRMLGLLTSMTDGKMAIELGTLAGFSAIWIARALAADGKLITIEPVDKHADFAESQFALAGVAQKIELRRGFGIPELEKLKAELAPQSVDVVFIDAIKTEYPDYFRLARDLVKPGGLFIADNILGSGSWWIDDEQNESRQAADRLSRTLAADDGFEAVAVPMREGVLVARRR